MAARHDIGNERELWDQYAGSNSVRDTVKDAPPVFCWTQYKGHGPGTEVLGRPASALEIGCGTGRAAAYLAGEGVEVTAVDLSPVMVEGISERWGSLGARFVCAEVLEYLRDSTDTYEAVYSIFGAAWFADPARLFPLVAQRLAAGGVFAFSQPPAIPGAYGPQGMYKGGFAGRALYTYRYSYTPRKWCNLLRKAGFADAEARVIQAPEPDHIGTLFVRAVMAGRAVHSPSGD
ncbi:methyltransferase type 11 [Streptomyces alboflavus]|uniref:Methyltransferase type 11 n=1 Tax=Streptomyces alboflavus TaxID=67267 RepID=A0A1Z1W9Z3_9ACTN|nr:class I SAM-dependent methyltransferase [Streptomyces alboflavus]ARX83254.1 methyltransferase type 11 [Streptomyces alboflavus]